MLSVVTVAASPWSWAVPGGAGWMGCRCSSGCHLWEENSKPLVVSLKGFVDFCCGCPIPRSAKAGLDRVWNNLG